MLTALGALIKSLGHRIESRCAFGAVGEEDCGGETNYLQLFDLIDLTNFLLFLKKIPSLLMMLLRVGCNSYKKIRNQGWERIFIKNER